MFNKKVEVLNRYLIIYIYIGSLSIASECLYGNIRFWILQAMISCWRTEST